MGYRDEVRALRARKEALEAEVAELRELEEELEDTEAELAERDSEIARLKRKLARLQAEHGTEEEEEGEGAADERASPPRPANNTARAWLTGTVVVVFGGAALITYYLTNPDAAPTPADLAEEGVDYDLERGSYCDVVTSPPGAIVRGNIAAAGTNSIDVSGSPEQQTWTLGSTPMRVRRSIDYTVTVELEGHQTQTIAVPELDVASPEPCELAVTLVKE